MYFSQGRSGLPCEFDAIYGDLYQIKLKGITNENHLVTHLGFTSGRHYDVIKIANIVSVQFKRYVHCSIWGSGLTCILKLKFNLRG